MMQTIIRSHALVEKFVAAEMRKALQVDTQWMYKVLYFSGDLSRYFSYLTTCNKDGVNLGVLVNDRIVMRQWYAVPGHMRKNNSNRWRGLNATLQATDTVLVHRPGRS